MDYNVVIIYVNYIMNYVMFCELKRFQNIMYKKTSNFCAQKSLEELLKSLEVVTIITTIRKKEKKKKNKKKEELKNNTSSCIHQRIEIRGQTTFRKTGEVDADNHRLPSTRSLPLDPIQVGRLNPNGCISGG